VAEDEQSVERTDEADTGSDWPTDERASNPPADERESSSPADDETDPLEELGFDLDSQSETDALDAAAGSFVRLEGELDGVDEASAQRVRGRALVSDAERVDASVVPEDYPLDIDSEEALALTLDPGAGEATAYLDWPTDGGSESPLRYLLDATDSRLGDLYGEAVFVERTGGHYVVVTPTERPRSSGDWGLGVGGGHAVAAGLLALLPFSGLSLPTVALWLFVTVLWIPYATYRDAWYLRTHSDWTGGPLFWATLSTIPGLNLLVGAAYLRQRARARFFGEEPTLPARAVARVRNWL